MKLFLLILSLFFCKYCWSVVIDDVPDNFKLMVDNPMAEWQSPSFVTYVTQPYLQESDAVPNMTFWNPNFPSWQQQWSRFHKFFPKEPLTAVKVVQTIGMARRGILADKNALRHNTRTVPLVVEQTKGVLNVMKGTLGIQNRSCNKEEEAVLVREILAVGDFLTKKSLGDELQALHQLYMRASANPMHQKHFQNVGRLLWAGHYRKFCDFSDTNTTPHVWLNGPDFEQEKERFSPYLVQFLLPEKGWRDKGVPDYAWPIRMTSSFENNMRYREQTMAQLDAESPQWRNILEKHSFGARFVFIRFILPNNNVEAAVWVLGEGFYLGDNRDWYVLSDVERQQVQQNEIVSLFRDVMQWLGTPRYSPRMAALLASRLPEDIRLEQGYEPLEDAIAIGGTGAAGGAGGSTSVRLKGAAFEVHNYAKDVGDSVIRHVIDKLGEVDLQTYESVKKDIIIWIRKNIGVADQSVACQAIKNLEDSDPDKRLLELIYTFVNTLGKAAMNTWLESFVKESIEAYLGRKNPLSCTKGVRERAYLSLRAIDNPEIQGLFGGAEKKLWAQQFIPNHTFGGSGNERKLTLVAKAIMGEFAKIPIRERPLRITGELAKILFINYAKEKFLNEYDYTEPEFVAFLADSQEKFFDLIEDYFDDMIAPEIDRLAAAVDGK